MSSKKGASVSKIDKDGSTGEELTREIVTDLVMNKDKVTITKEETENRDGTYIEQDGAIKGTLGDLQATAKAATDVLRKERETSALKAGLKPLNSTSLEINWTALPAIRNGGPQFVDKLPKALIIQFVRDKNIPVSDFDYGPNIIGEQAMKDLTYIGASIEGFSAGLVAAVPKLDLSDFSKDVELMREVQGLFVYPVEAANQTSTNVYKYQFAAGLLINLLNVSFCKDLIVKGLNK